MEEFTELQLAEIEVIKAIYGPDFESVVSKTAWQTVNAVHEFRVMIHPQVEDLKGQIGVKLHFKLPLRYPKVAPTMSLEDPFGMTTASLANLLTALKNQAQHFIGDQMLFELCDFAGVSITDANLGKGKSREKESLGEERKKRTEEEEKAATKAASAEAARLAAIKAESDAAEAARMSLLISADVRRKEEIRAEKEREEQEAEDAEDEEFEAVEGVIRMRVGIMASHPGLETASPSVASKALGSEAVVKLGICLGEDWPGKVMAAEVTIGMEPPVPATARVFDILSAYFVTSQGKRKLSKVESDLGHLGRLRHPHILGLYGFHLQRHRPNFLAVSPFSTASAPSSRSSHSSAPKAGYTLIVLTAPIDPTHSQSLESLLLSAGELRPDRALTFFTQLVSAVECLHSANVLHKAIRPRAVLIRGDKVKEVQLADANWWKRLVDLNKSDPWVGVPPGVDDEIPEAWVCPGALDEPFVYEKYRDVWDLGVLLAQMLSGLDIFQRYPSPAALIRGIPIGSAPTIRKFLSDLLLVDNKKRPTAAQLSHQLVESSSSGSTLVMSSSSGLSTTPKNATGFSLRQPKTPFFSPDRALAQNPIQPLSKSVDGQVGFFWQPRSSGSRYRMEFEELEFLGRGGGGQVVKARNRLDGHLYAVKKIRLPSDRASEAKLLREVTIWSRMNHPNIVRYHTSWVETDEQPTFAGGSTAGETSTQRTETDVQTSTDDSRSTSQTKTVDSDDDEEEDPPSDFDADDDDYVPGNDLDIDLGLDDFDDDVDFLSVGHSKASRSYPSIHFGNDSDSKQNSTATNSPAVMSRQATRESSPAPPAKEPKQVRTLYIQMEYVEKATLKEAIEDGVSETDSWRLIFQMLSATAHFTSLNIIHRDLKPANIFLDSKGDVRIGDFGLAVNQGLADPTDSLLELSTSVDDLDLTSGVGTSLYIAPESLSRGKIDRSVKYSNKIDMYSLGIVFFELWHPFKTGMERIHVLRDLRKPEIKFPPSWDKLRLARHTKIVEACLTHDPELRVSPKDLLNSDLLPPRVGDASIEETLRLLSYSGTPHAQTLIAALFNQTAEDRDRKDFSYDLYDAEGPSLNNDPYAEMVREKLSRIFHRKGAVCMDTPLLMPHSSIYGTRNPVRLLDNDGTITCLPFHLNIPFCRMVARDSSLVRLKRWTLAHIYRSSGPAGGQPRAVLNAAFDIVSDTGMQAASMAECIYITEEAILSFPFTGETIHYLNHSRILDAIIDRCPPQHRTAVLEVLSQHGRLQRPWAKTAIELLKIRGMTRALIDEIGSFDVVGNISDIRARVISSASRMKHVLQEAFDELQEIVVLCQQLGVKTIKVSPLLATNWDFHRNGVLFESHQIKGKVRDVIAAGGTFDHVVAQLAAPDVRLSGRYPHVVGFSMSIAKLSATIAEANASIGKVLVSRREESTRSYGPWAVRRCDCYVVSFTRGLIDARLDVVKDLWKVGIRADIMYDGFVALSPEAMVNACRREGIYWLVIVKSGQERRPGLSEVTKTVKVKSVLRGYEEEVPRPELTTWLAREMREQALVDEAFGGSSAVVHSLVEPLSSGMTEAVKPTQEFVAVLADDDVRQKGRQKQKNLIISRASKNIEATTLQAAESPVFAIDVEGPTFAKLTESPNWIVEDEAFRAILHVAAPIKRPYLTSIRATIVKHRARTRFQSLWLFSLREDQSSFLTFHV